jgi:two-component system sensor histidine kinase/response regulator
MPTNKEQKVLIVEDNQENLDLLTYFLRPQGYNLIHAPDGIQALKMVEDENPDIILLDIMLPKLDGFQVCERLKTNEKTKFIPIIMITALKELKDKIRSLEAGADDFITKPFENIELLARVKSLLRLKEYHDELESKNKELKGKNQSLLRIDMFKEDLVNLIVHDMKNPLFVIQGNLQMMSMTMNTMSQENLKKYTQRIERSSQQLLRMVINLLDISRIEEGTMILKKDLVEFNKIVLEISQRVKEYPENDKKEFIVDLDESLAEMIFDKSVIERAVENIINFASNNSGDEGKVNLSTKRLSGNKLLFKVHDTGTQIPKKFHDKIFEKLSQAEIKSDGYRVDRALGLTYCKMAVEAHKGNMYLDIENPIGNLFVLELPSLEFDQI